MNSFVKCKKYMCNIRLRSSLSQIRNTSAVKFLKFTVDPPRWIAIVNPEEVIGRLADRGVKSRSTEMTNDLLLALVLLRQFVIYKVGVGPRRNKSGLRQLEQIGFLFKSISQSEQRAAPL